jgi:hypothetical protein
MTNPATKAKAKTKTRKAKGASGRTRRDASRFSRTVKRGKRGGCTKKWRDSRATRGGGKGDKNKSSGKKPPGKKPAAGADADADVWAEVEAAAKEATAAKSETADAELVAVVADAIKSVIKYNALRADSPDRDSLILDAQAKLVKFLVERGKAGAKAGLDSAIALGLGLEAVMSVILKMDVKPPQGFAAAAKLSGATTPIPGLDATIQAMVVAGKTIADVYKSTAVPAIRANLDLVNKMLHEVIKIASNSDKIGEMARKSIGSAFKSGAGAAARAEWDEIADFTHLMKCAVLAVLAVKSRNYDMRPDAPGKMGADDAVAQTAVARAKAVLTDYLTRTAAFGTTSLSPEDIKRAILNALIDGEVVEASIWSFVYLQLDDEWESPILDHVFSVANHSKVAESLKGLAKEAVLQLRARVHRSVQNEAEENEADENEADEKRRADAENELTAAAVAEENEEENEEGGGEEEEEDVYETLSESDNDTRASPSESISADFAQKYDYVPPQPPRPPARIWRAERESLPDLRSREPSTDSDEEFYLAR